MGGFDGAAAEPDRAADHLVDRELAQSRPGADDVDDGIDRPDLVEVDVVEGDVVDGGLGLAQAAERGSGPGGHRLG